MARRRWAILWVCCAAIPLAPASWPIPASAQRGGRSPSRSSASRAGRSHSRASSRERGVQASIRCSLYAAPDGSNRANGSLATPFATPQRLIDTLHAGQTGCLRGGVYESAITVARGGERGRPLTLTSSPGERARMIGRLYVRPGAHDLDFLRLDLDGRNALALPSPTVFGSDVTFSGDDVTNEHSAICFDLGEAGGPVARNIAIERSVVHDCGRLPAGNHEHGIYIENTRDVRIAWNLIFANADRGIQLYPDAQTTSIVHNVIYGNGEGILFSGGSGTASSGALVAHNVISDSDVRSNVESWYPAGNPRGSHNMVTKNCIGASYAIPLNRRGGGFDVLGNLMIEPLFANASTHDFRLLPASPCLGLSGDVSSVVAAAL
jgi:hypothetical protein